MSRRTLTQERARDFFANATAWDFGDHHGRPDLELMREQRYEEWDQMIAKVRADAVREVQANVRASSFWAEGRDNYADRVRGFLGCEADRIERDER